MPTKRGFRERNLAISHAQKAIGLIADDDLVFLKGFDEKIAKGFNHFPGAAAIKFITVTFREFFSQVPKRSCKGTDRFTTVK
jgi:hypothetical protein